MPDGALVSRCAHGWGRGTCVLACGAGVLALLCVLSSAAIAMTACQPSRPSDARDYWAWRLIDGRQCWYQGQPGRSKATLFWPAEQPSSSEPEVEQPEQLAMADEERALLESYWPDLDTLPVVFPTDRWWPRDIVFVDMTRGPPAIRSAGYEGAIAALLLMLAAVCLVWLALVLLKRRMSDGEVVLGAARQLWLRWLNPSAACASDPGRYGIYENFYHRRPAPAASAGMDATFARRQADALANLPVPGQGGFCESGDAVAPANKRGRHSSALLGANRWRVLHVSEHHSFAA
jgi:hypothetical protein